MRNDSVGTGGLGNAGHATTSVGDAKGESRKALTDSLLLGAFLEVQGIGECHLLERNPKARRGLLVLLADGTIQAVEEAMCLKVKRPAMALKDRVMVPRAALTAAFPSFRWKDGTCLPKEGWKDQSKIEAPYTRDNTSYGVIGVYSGGHLANNQKRAWASERVGVGTHGGRGNAGRELEKNQEAAKTEDLRGQITR